MPCRNAELEASVKDHQRLLADTKDKLKRARASLQLPAPPPPPTPPPAFAHISQRGDVTVSPAAVRLVQQHVRRNLLGDMPPSPSQDPQFPRLPRASPDAPVLAAQLAEGSILDTDPSETKPDLEHRLDPQGA